MRRLKIILPVLTVMAVAFIWGHSLMPGDASAEESGFVLEFIRSLPGCGSITDHFIRKTAHFAEYMLLGILCCADFRVYGKSGIKYVFMSLYICLFTAVADESIQLFTVGRSGALIDVWLDHIGSITGSAVLNVLYAAAKGTLVRIPYKKST